MTIQLAVDVLITIIVLCMIAITITAIIFKYLEGATRKRDKKAAIERDKRIEKEYLVKWQESQK